jgi:hypothetical protein
VCDQRSFDLAARRLIVAIRRALIFILLGSVLAVALPSRATAADALPWFHTYHVPGGYAAGGVDRVTVSVGNGLRTRRIVMGDQLPPNAEILAAFLYWETMWRGPNSTVETLRRQVMFRGQPVTGIKTTTQPLTADCRAESDGEEISMMRADVLRLLPLQLDVNGKPTGRRIVNDSELAANNLEAHTVTLPDSGVVNLVPQSAGASLLVIYQDPNPSTPLTTVSIYDGLHIQAEGAATEQTIRGLQDIVRGSPARLTVIGGSGAANVTERVLFGGSLQVLRRIDTGNPFPAGGSLTARAWSTLTLLPLSKWAPGDGGVYGEQVAAKIDHALPGSYDCLSTGAIVFSAHTEDGDGDGLPTLLETHALLNPAGLPYPDISAMGAHPNVRDLFIEIGAMWSNAWNPATSAQTPVPAAHDHMPDVSVLKMVGDALRNAPSPHAPIAVHFDVGPVLGSAYQAVLQSNSDPFDDDYVIAGNVARGGERIQEVECVEDEEPGTPPCRFPGFRGVVSWPAGFQFLARAPVGPDGSELADPEAAGWCDTSSAADCRRRFDLEREGIFHYILYAHTRGVRKSDFPCLAAPDAMGHQDPVPYPDNTVVCGALDDNPEYYIPKSVSGVAELPGRFALVTLGQWDNAVGTRGMQANTTLHELGHNLDLWHGGGKPQFLSTGAGLSVFVQPQCKPNHLSIMSYMFQATGVRDGAGNSRARLSGEFLNPLDEGALIVGTLGLSPDAPFTSWYAPKAGSLGETLDLTPATKHCDGTLLLPGDPETVRLDATSPDQLIDWAAGGGPHAAQDINFDGKTTGAASQLTGYNDWDGIALNRLGFGHSMFGFSLGQGLDFGGLDFGGLDFGGLDFGGLDFGGLDFGGLDFGGLDFGGFIGGLDFGGLDFGGLDFGGLDFGGLDFGGLDFGGLDFGGLDFGGLESEVDAELTREIVEESIAPGGSTPPNALTACVIGGTQTGPNCQEGSEPLHRHLLNWEPPNVGTPDGYAAFRVWDDPTDGPSNAPTPGQTRTDVGTTTGATSTTLTDLEELPDGQRFIYWVRGSTSGQLGSPSNFAIVTAQNTAPVAVNDAVNGQGQPIYSLPEDSPDTLFASVLDNDTDEDSPDKSTWGVVLVDSTDHGTLVLHPDGTFHYMPEPDFFGTDTFTYKANNGTFCPQYSADDPETEEDESTSCAVSQIPMSLDSAEAVVTIEVRPVNDVPSFTAGPNQSADSNVGPRTVPNWATNISAGPANEGNQVVDFIVTNSNNEAFLVQPAVAPDGTLTYTTRETASGVVSVSVTIHDNGGTADGGVDTSAAQLFTITISEPYRR